MKIDLDKVWDEIKPRRLTLKIDGVDRELRRLALADARWLTEQFNQSTPAGNKAWLVGLFSPGDPPAAVARMADEMGEDDRRENDAKITLLLDAIFEFMLTETTAKKIDAARVVLKAQAGPPEHSNASL